MKRALVLCGLLSACAAAPPRKVAPPPAPSPPPAPAHAQVEVEEPTEPAVDPSAGSDYRTPVGIAGCTTENLVELRTRLETIDKRLRYSKQLEGPETIVADVREAWQHPCLSHFARVFQPPSPSIELSRLVELWHRGVGGALRAMAGAVYKRNGKNYVVAPPEEHAPVSAKDRAAFVAWSCPDPTAACSQAGSYVARAHDAFDREEELAYRWNGPLVGGEGNERLPNSFLATRLGCDREQDEAERAAETPFETFEKCVASSSPRTWRYPDATMRSRDRGWLVLRGRRGHYEFSDEVGVFDLATGAAYIARSSSALVLAGVGVDFDAVDKQRRPEVRAGSVAADQVREIAFLLATAPLLRPQRSNAQLVPMPEKLEVTLSKNHDAKRPFELGEAGWATSAQTHIAWQLVDGTTTLSKGELTWPSSYRAWETHVAELVRVMEAGFVPVCTPARLPRGVVRGPAGAVHPIDADPKAQADVFTTLGNQLEALPDRPCSK